MSYQPTILLVLIFNSIGNIRNLLQERDLSMERYIARTKRQYVIFLYVFHIILTFVNLIRLNKLEISIPLGILLVFNLLGMYGLLSNENQKNKVNLRTLENNMCTIGSSVVIVEIKPEGITRTILKNKCVYKQEFCKDCGFFQYNGTYHCHQCARCIDNHDHHCSWVGKCIGKQNYWFFIVTLNTTLILLSFNLFSYALYANHTFKLAYISILASFCCLFGVLCVYFWLLYLFNRGSRKFLKKYFNPKI